MQTIWVSITEEDIRTFSTNPRDTCLSAHILCCWLDKNPDVYVHDCGIIRGKLWIKGV